MQLPMHRSRRCGARTQKKPVPIARDGERAMQMHGGNRPGRRKEIRMRLSMGAIQLGRFRGGARFPHWFAR